METDRAESFLKIKGKYSVKTVTLELFELPVLMADSTFTEYIEDV